MKKLLITFFTISLLSSCSVEPSQRLEWVCSCQEQVKIVDFISSNIKSANNMSDEEVEDVIVELRRTGIKVHCKQKMIDIDGYGHIDWSKVKLDSCQILVEY